MGETQRSQEQRHHVSITSHGECTISRSARRGVAQNYCHGCGKIAVNFSAERRTAMNGSTASFQRK